jgi:hypothetical protein
LPDVPAFVPPVPIPPTPAEPPFAPPLPPFDAPAVPPLDVPPVSVPDTPPVELPELPPLASSSLVAGSPVHASANATSATQHDERRRARRLKPPCRSLLKEKALAIVAETSWQ